jgi:hypothetical protein
MLPGQLQGAPESELHCCKPARLDRKDILPANVFCNPGLLKQCNRRTPQPEQQKRSSFARELLRCGFEYTGGRDIDILRLAQAQNQHPHGGIMDKRLKGCLKFSRHGKEQRPGQIQDADRRAKLARLSWFGIKLTKPSFLTDCHLANRQQSRALQEEHNADANP